jgi:glycosyltransferase involved in cell wall biosynthesis
MTDSVLTGSKAIQPAPAPADEAGAAVTALIPARNEAPTIAVALESALATGARRVIVVDDHSTDATPDIVEALAANDERIQLLRAPALPSGWTGKNHALWRAVEFLHRESERGVESARGRSAGSSPAWLLFLDADSRLIPGGLQRALEIADTNALDALSLSPEQEIETFWERALIPLVYSELARRYPFDRVNDPTDACAAANGQFLLIRPAAYDRVGGHAAVRGEVLEDVRLAERIKAAGLRYRFLSGAGIVRTRMYRDRRSLREGWSKNLVSLFGTPAENPAMAARLLAPFAAAAVLAGSLARRRPIAGTAAFSALAVLHLRYRRRLRAQGLDGNHAALLLPAAASLAQWWLQSWWRAAAGKTVNWKGREYPGKNSQPPADTSNRTNG